MPRVPALPSPALPSDIAEVYERFVKFGAFADQAAVLAHVPPALNHLYQMLIELKTRRSVPWRYIELAVVVTSKLNACAYCVASHTPILAVEGLSTEAIARLPNADHPDLDRHRLLNDGGYRDRHDRRLIAASSAPRLSGVGRFAARAGAEG